MPKRRDARVDLIVKAKKNKISSKDFKIQIKYGFSRNNREYILRKLPKKYKDLAYNFPLPQEEEFISSSGDVYSTDSNLIDELAWQFEMMDNYTVEINKYLSIKKNIENSILIGTREKCYELLDKLETDVCCSLYSISTEMAINSIHDEQELNQEIIKGIPYKNNTLKLLILIDFARMRMDKKISFWQYDSIIDQHKKQYPEDSESLLEYIDFKLKPLEYEQTYNHLDFLVHFESDFSIIDRYNSIKRLLPIVLSNGDIKKEDKLFILDLSKKIAEKVQDTYWNRLFLLHDDKPEMEWKLNTINRRYNQIQDWYLKGNYDKVIESCFNEISVNPTSTELYIFFVKSLIYKNQKVEKYFENNELSRILSSIQKILCKGSNYYEERDSLLSAYYSISHLGFSGCLLEFLYNEFRIRIPQQVKINAYLTSESFRYNTYQILDSERLNLLLAKDQDNKTNDLIQRVLFDSEWEIVNEESFFKYKLIIGCLIKREKFDEAINILKELEGKNSSVPKAYESIQTWLTKNLLKCYLSTKKHLEVAEIVVDSFFKKKIAYDHFFDEDFIHSLIEVDDEEVYKSISIPILFEIYGQSQHQIYDSLANFLISHNVFKPSELIDVSDRFKSEMFLYLLENVCTRDNIQDSPFLNTIESLDEERIKILNFLKQINEHKSSLYNEEILNITKEASIREGLLQLHESRIYIDTLNVYKKLEVQLTEVFDRYLGLDDISYSGISSLKLNDKAAETIAISYYFKKPISKELLPYYMFTTDPREDENAVVVPLIRLVYFIDLFNSIKESFVFDEDYGFKSFLSMRIRHGTFSNVLRSVFDKHKVISSKVSGSDSYLENDFWSEKLTISKNKLTDLQKLLKQFSREVDDQIDLGLSWISIASNTEQDDTNSEGIFNFHFIQDELYGIFHNRIGRIDNYKEFVDEVFDVLYERLEDCLKSLRQKISRNLANSFVKLLENLQKDIENLEIGINNFNLIEQEIISCKTEIQVTTKQIEGWFKVSKNQYIDEFPIDTIVQTSLDYINSINMNTIREDLIDFKSNCQIKLKGEYFESFGDIFINLFDNIVSKNRDLGNQLKIVIEIDVGDNFMKIKVRNNLSRKIDLDELSKKIKEIKLNVANYKNGGVTSSFESGSGYLKICKSISIGLERENYFVVPEIQDNSFEANISFNLKNLVA